MEGGKEAEAEAEAEAEPSSPESNGDEEISEYEQQRLARIRENRARLEALGLPALASSLLGSLPKDRKGQEKAKGKKKKKGGDDEEYRPSDEDEGESCSASEEEGDDVGPSSSRSRKKVKKSSSNVSKVRKSSLSNRVMKESDYMDDDSALQQAIALSLGGAKDDLAGIPDVASEKPSTSVGEAIALGKKDNRMTIHENSQKSKSRKMIKSRIQLTDDEVIAYFFSFDEAGKGYITLRDLERMVIAHDFSWTEMDMAKMIHSFDSNEDGKLSLEDFQTIVSRCNMRMQEP